MAFVELKARREVAILNKTDLRMRFYSKRKKYQLIIRIGKELMEKSGIIIGGRVSFFYDDEDKSVFLLKRIEDINDRGGYKVGKTYTIQVGWDINIFTPTIEQEKPYNVKYELVPEGIKVYSSIKDED